MKKIKIEKSNFTIKLAIAFWAGIGLMSIINVWKITYTKSAVPYSWIMFFISIIFILISLVLMKNKR